MAKKEPDGGAKRTGQGASQQQRAKNRPATDPRKQAEPKTPKHGQGRGSGGGV